MSLAGRLKEQPPLTKGPRCLMGLLLEELPKSEAEALRRALADPNWRTTAIREALYAEGHKLSQTSVARHRRGACQCEALGVQ